MKKKNFISLLLGTIGTLLFGIGMCMCLLPEWNTFHTGILVGVVGALILLCMLIVRRKMEGKPAIECNAKAIGIFLFGILAAIIFGIGMSMTLVSHSLFLPGIAIGIFGIMLLLCLIPLGKGLK